MAEGSINMTKDRLLDEMKAAKDVAWSIHKKRRDQFERIGIINIFSGAVVASSSVGVFGAASLPIITGLAGIVSACASGWLALAKPDREASKGESAAAELELVRNLLRTPNGLTVEQGIYKYNEIQQKYPFIVKAAMT